VLEKGDDKSSILQARNAGFFILGLKRVCYDGKRF